MTRLDLARVRHENYMVLGSIRQCPDLTRAERAERLGYNEFQLAIIENRLRRTGLL